MMCCSQQVKIQHSRSGRPPVGRTSRVRARAPRLTWLSTRRREDDTRAALWQLRALSLRNRENKSALTTLNSATRSPPRCNSVQSDSDSHWDCASISIALISSSDQALAQNIPPAITASRNSTLFSLVFSSLISRDFCLCFSCRSQHGTAQGSTVLLTRPHASIFTWVTYVPYRCCFIF